MKNIFIILSILLLMNDVKAKKGHKKSVGEQRMIGGTDASLEDWNFIVYLSFHQENPLWKTCGGALIAKNLVLTAAHCIEDIVENPEKVRVGVHMTTRTTSFVEGKNMSVIKIFPHHQFVHVAQRVGDVTWSFDADIAILKLEKEVSGPHTTVKLPAFRENPTKRKNIKCKTAGWGKTTPFETAEQYENKEYEVSDVLKEFPVSLVKKKICNASLPLQARPLYGNMRRILCGGKKGEGETTSPCAGDSGSPLVCKDPEGANVLEGIVLSGPFKCETGKGYQYFAWVGIYMAWINRMIEENKYIPK